MTFVVEDGSGVTGANSYASIDQADAYHLARGNTAWAEALSSPDDARESALVRATAWIDGVYGSRFSGKRTNGRSQSLQWPRTCATDAECEIISSDEIPVEIINATCEAALRELADAGSLSPDYIQSQRVVSEQVGSLSVTYQSTFGGARDARPVLTIIQDILSTLIGSSRPSYIGTAERA